MAEASRSAAVEECFFLRSRPEMGDPVRAGLLAREREGESPRTTSSLRAEKKPCFFSIFSEDQMRKLLERERERVKE